MAEQHPDHRAGPGPEVDPESSPDAQGDKKLTVFGEPLWVDTLKALGVASIMLVLLIVVGGALGVAIIALWGRASHDCSIYCVLEQYYDSLFADAPS